jgi:Lrp/AsnC family transcriptional regulator
MGHGTTPPAQAFCYLVAREGPLGGKFSLFAPRSRISLPQNIDTVDLRILAALQEDATLTVSEIAERIHLSPTPCWRRIQKLQRDGVIRKRVTLLDASKLNAGVTVFVSVKTAQHNAAWLDRFAAAVAAIPEVVEFYRMSGEIDYLLRVMVPDIAGYDAVYKKLIRSAELFDVSSSFAMEQIKYTTAVPLTFAGVRPAETRRKGRKLG